MNALLVTGTGANAAYSGLGLQPDLVVIKSRSAVGRFDWFDSVRGPTIRLDSSTTEAEAADNDVFGFDADGFQGNLNNGTTYVAWGWKESATAGFDIVTYTGTGANRTVAHSLGVAPSMMIIKRRDAVDQWWVYSNQLANTQYLQLNLTNAAQTSSTLWNSTSPTSSVFSLGVNNANTNTGTYVAYLFAEVAGYSKFGKYTGNGSADGPFIHLGFRPRWIMFKSTSTGGVGYGWSIYDTERDTYNQNINPLNANASAAESTTSTFAIDLVSNGIKLRGLNQNINQSGVTYVYAAFAENPYKYSLAR